MHDDGARIWAVLPIKRLAAAKRRLEPLLGAGCAEFARLSACRTLDVLCGSRLFAGVIAVTPDPLIAWEAQARGAQALDDGGIALNGACALGLAAAAARAADVCVLMPSDLATLTVAGVARVVRRYLRLRASRGRGCIGMVRCKEGTGTNLLALDPALAFTPSFGPGSFARHARAFGERCVELVGSQVAFDIDSADDFRALAAALDRSERPDALARWVLGHALSAA
jgi:2-phospho-L-lactate guanylyltransferase (CobY/MobA/RfbA family)